MSDEDRITLGLVRLKRVRRAQLVLDHAMRGIFWGAAVAALAVFATKLWMLPVGMYWLAGGALGLSVAAFAVRAMLLRLTPLHVAVDVDARLGLRERVSSAVALGIPAHGAVAKKRPDPFVRAIVRDAARAVEKARRVRIYPWSLPRAWRYALPALLIACALTFVPQLNWFVRESDRAQAKLVHNEGQQLLDLAKKLSEEAKRTQDPVLKKQAQEVKRVADKLSSGQMPKREALKQLESLSQKLQAQNQPPSGERKLLGELGKQMSGKESTKDLSQMLGKGDLEGFSAQLKELAQKAASGQLSLADQQALSDMLKALDEALKSQAANDPSAQALKNNLEDLKNALAKNQQLQQSLQDEMNGFKDALQNLTSQLSQNGMNQQAGKLNELMRKMESQLAQTGTLDPQTLKDMLSALQDAQSAISSNQQLSRQQQDALGKACQKAMGYLQSPSGKEGQLSDANRQAGKNNQQLKEPLDKSGECSGGG